MRTIDADALIKALEVTQYNDIDDLSRTEDLIDNAPTIEYPFYQEAYQSGYEEGKKIARPQGKWVIEHDWVHCFPCGHEQNYPSNFCPNCGAEMRKGDNNDN